MAYVNVREWSVEQVTDWMKGLDSNVTRYSTCFLNNGVDGHQLLNLRVDDLEHFGVMLQGHQELILEAVELLRNFHYELDKENVQALALRLVCAARGISRDLQLRDIKAQKVPTQTMSDVHSLVAIVKPLVQWLDRRPFSAESEYVQLSTDILQYSYIMVHHTHRDDTFAIQPLVSIIGICDQLIKLGNRIVQEVSDPMILQPATLDLANLKKKEQELGFYILASNTAVHQVAEIAFGSPAQINSKIEVGDEIVQVNYQTIVGWQRKSVLRLLQLSSPDIVLTLKKRPRHTKMYGQIYMQPYRLPSKKRDNNSYPHWNWNFDNIPSPRLFNLPASNIQLSTDTIQIPKTKAPVLTQVTDLDDLSESSSESDDDGPSLVDSNQPMLINDNQGQGRLYPTKPRMLLQRRNTISGSTLSCSRPTDLIAQFYQELKKQASSNNASASNIRLEREKFKEDSIHIRDKSVSCSHVLESGHGRPTTVIGGISAAPRLHKATFPPAIKKNEDNNTITVRNKDDIEISAISAISLSSLNQDSSIDFIDEGEDLMDRSKMNLIKIKDSALEEVHVNTIRKKFEPVFPPEIQPRTKLATKLIDVKLDKEVLERKPPEIPNKPKPQVFPRSAKNRGHLDKAHSTPAYDLTAQLAVSSLNEEHVYNVEYPAKSIENEILGLNAPKSPNILEVPPKPPPRVNKPPAKLPEIEDFLNVPLIENTKHINKLQENSNTNVCPIIDHSNSQNQLNYNHPDVVPILTPTSVASTSDYDHFRFDPMTSSSPIVKNQPRLTTLTTEKHKISTSTNNLVSMIYPMSKGKAKKKNSLLAKRRNVSVVDVSPGEVQGLLFQRLRHKQTQIVHWEKRWFVLNTNCLYGFKSKESQKADCYIYLSGFTVTVANEVKSRTNAFKVYHTGTVFYFSAENSESQSSWIDLIACATLSSDSLKSNNDQNFYSETDDDSSNESNTKPQTEKSSESGRKFNSLKKFARKRNDSSNSSVSSGSTSLDRKWFFNKTISSSKSSIPVKTDQFRSYRKISTSTTTGNFTSHIPNFAPQTSNVSSPNLASIEDLHSTKIQRIKHTNQIHNSNPSLATSQNEIICNYSAGQAAPSNKIKNESLEGFVTLKELMYRQQEERKLNPHFQAQAVNFHNINQNLIRADVVYGELPSRSTEVDKEKLQHVRTSSDCGQVIVINDASNRESTSSCFGKRSGSSFKRTSSKNNSLPKQSNLYKEMSYEMIYCPLQTGTDVVQFAQNRKVQQQDMQPNAQLHHYTPMATPFTPEERFQQDMATMTASATSPLHSSGSGGKGSSKLNKFFGTSSRQDTNKRSKKSGEPSPNCQSTKLHKRKLGACYTSSVQPSGHEQLPIEYSWINRQQGGTDQHLADQMLQVQYPTTELDLRNSTPSTGSGDYPGLEYPPVFEPETYSLADPHNTSLTLLRKQDSYRK